MTETDELNEFGREPGFSKSVFGAVFVLTVLICYTCNGIRVIGYSKQLVKIVGKVVVTCYHADTTKQCVFYVTDLNDTKILLGLTFCKAFNLVKTLCDDDCICKKVTVDVLNEFPAGLDVPNQEPNGSCLLATS